jgi:hypothetical protein
MTNMRPRTHSDCVNLLRLAVSDLGGLSLKYTTGMFLAPDSPRKVKVGQDGAADIVACIGGRAVFIEAKLDHDVWRPDQQLFADAVRKAGGLYVLARFSDKEDGVATLREAVAC